jgi:hypothetical protein
VDPEAISEAGDHALAPDDPSELLSDDDVADALRRPSVSSSAEMTCALDADDDIDNNGDNDDSGNAETAIDTVDSAQLADVPLLKDRTLTGTARAREPTAVGGAPETSVSPPSDEHVISPIKKRSFGDTVSRAQPKEQDQELQRSASRHVFRS